MDEAIAKAKRTRKVNVERRVASIDAKIAKLEAEKAELLKPMKIKQLINEAVENMDLEEVASRLDIKIDE